MNAPVLERSRELSTVQVTRQGVPVTNINELEYFDGSVWANVWFSDEILRIDLSSGNVTDAINFAAIYPKKLRDKELTSVGMCTLQCYIYICMFITMCMCTISVNYYSVLCNAHMYILASMYECMDASRCTRCITFSTVFKSDAYIMCVLTSSSLARAH